MQRNSMLYIHKKWVVLHGDRFEIDWSHGQMIKFSTRMREMKIMKKYRGINAKNCEGVLHNYKCFFVEKPIHFQIKGNFIRHTP